KKDDLNSNALDTRTHLHRARSRYCRRVRADANRGATDAASWAVERRLAADRCRRPRLSSLFLAISDVRWNPSDLLHTAASIPDWRRAATLDSGRAVSRLAQSHVS